MNIPKTQNTTVLLYRNSIMMKMLLLLFMLVFLHPNVYAQPCLTSSFQIIDAIPGNPTLFRWTDSCADAKNYEIQILRLYNTDPSALLENNITAKVDWSQAISYIVGKNKSGGTLIWECDWLTLAEGTGFYVWRIRRVKGEGHNKYADPENWSDWTGTGSYVDGASANATASMASSYPYLFFYDQFDDDINWLYKRAFMDDQQWDFRSSELNETIDYMDYLLMPLQKQKQIHETRFNSNRHTLVSQTVVDNSGRPSLSTLPIPGDTWLSYQKDLLKNSSGNVYSADDYDNISTYNNPSNVSGNYSDYYSDANTDKQIPTAAERPFARTLYFNDGLSRPREIVTPGAVHQADPNYTTNKSTTNTIRKFYSTATETELIYMFGDEAPKAETVLKTFSEDPNGTWTITYTNELDQVLASCYSKPMSNLTNNSVSYIPMSLGDTIREKIEVSPTQFLSTKTYTFAEPTSLSYIYSILPKNYGNLCMDICGTCDYRVRLTAKERDDTITYRRYLEVPPTFDTVSWTCAGSELSINGTYQLPTTMLDPGTYDITLFIELNNVNPTTGRPYVDELVEKLHRKIDTSLYKTGGYVLPYSFGDTPRRVDSMLFYANNADYERLVRYLDADTSQSTFDIVFNGWCDTITLPTVKCKQPSCSPALFSEFMKKKLQDEDTRNGNSFFINAYTNTTNKGIAFTTDTSNLFKVDSDVEFNNIITSMIADGYSCDVLWSAWRQTVGNYIVGQRAMIDPMYTTLEDTMGKYDWWGYFMKLVGYKVALTQRPYSELFSSTSLCRTKPYQYFPYDWGSKPDLEQVFCYMYSGSWPCSTSTWISYVKNFPTYDPVKESFHTYNFYTNIKTSNYLASYKKLKSLTSIFNPTNSISTQVIAQGQNMCIEGCKSRLPQLVNDVALSFMDDHKIKVEGFLYDTWRLPSVDSVNLGQVFCLANAVVEQCKTMCDVTPDSGAFLSAAKLLTITKAMVYDVRVHTKPAGLSVSCPSGYDSVAAVPMSVQMAMLNFLNMSVRSVLDSLSMTNSKTTTWPLLIKNFSLGSSTPLNSPPCNDMAVMIAGDDKRAFLHYGTDGTTYSTCTAEQVLLSRTAVDSVYKGWETSVKLSVKLNVNLPANDSMVFYENIPSGFTYISGDGVYNSGQMKYVILGPLYSGDIMEINYTMKAPTTAGTQAFSGYLNRYSSGSLIESCSTNTQSIVVASCLALKYRRELANGEFESSVVCTNICDYTDSCNYQICLNWDMSDNLDLDDYPDSTLRVKSCGELVCAGFLQTLGYGMYTIHNKQEALLRQSYKDKCTNRGAIDDMFRTEHGLETGQFTLFTYDRAGNLIRTVAPNGADPNTSATRMTKITNDYRSEYDHDTRGKVLRQYTTDGNQSLFWYTNSGLLRFSQTATQKSDGKYTYYKYDALDRLGESGEQNWGGYGFDASDIENMSYPTVSGSNTDHLTQVFYDNEYPYPVGGWPFTKGSGPLTGGTYQKWLNNRVSYTVTDRDADLTTTADQVINMYSYDPQGNVEYYYQYLDNMDVKVVKYDNAIFSGKVNSYEILSYNGYPISQDKLKVVYEYNMEGKPEYVFTADPDNNTWGKKTTTFPPDSMAIVANYTFNQHDDNQLKRTELGKRLQGLDYTYTIEGWLKAINHPKNNMDPGGDGTTGKCRTDLYSQLNHYYETDFDRPSSQFMNNTTEFLTGTNLYNGVITGMQTKVKAPPSPTGNHYEGLATGNAFEYDELYRLKQSVFNWYDSTKTSGSKWYNANPHVLGSHNTGITPFDYDEEFDYDMNGNFKSLKRWTGTGSTPPLTPVQIEDATYTYNGASNRLSYFSDALGNAGYDDPETTTYGMDASGRVTGVYTWMPTPEMWTLNWRYDDKPTYLQTNSRPSAFPTDGIRYLYDANGNRVQKYTTSHSGSSYTNSTECYVYGADGTLLATYANSWVKPTPSAMPYVGAADVKERYIYGVDRVGTIMGTNNTGSFYNYNMQYEVHDHLGNVRAIFNNTPSGSFPAPPDVTTYNNYYAFGSLQANRHYNATNYSMGFNGQMKEEGILTGGNSTTMGNTHGALNFAKYWMYDTRIGRRWNIDPVDMISQSNYSINGNNPICNSDPDGRKYYNFNSRGEFTGVSNDNWLHNIFYKQGRIMGDDGKVIRKFGLADRKNDAKEIEEGTIKKVVFVSDEQMRLMVARSGGFSSENKTANRSWSERYDYILEAGQGGGLMDFSYTQIRRVFPDASEDPDDIPSSMLFLPPSPNGARDFAHNHMNFGNFLFGLSGEAQGFAHLELSLGAHHRARTQNGDDGYKNQWDSKDDQFSIKRGFEYGKAFYYDKKEFKVLPGKTQPLILTPVNSR